MNNNAILAAAILYAKQQDLKKASRLFMHVVNSSTSEQIAEIDVDAMKEEDGEVEFKNALISNDIWSDPSESDGEVVLPQVFLAQSGVVTTCKTPVEML